MDSWLQASLHSVRDLALLASACAAVTRMRANECNIAKAACGVGLPCIVKYTINLGRGRDFVSSVAAFIG